MEEWRTINERQGYEVSIATKEGMCRNKKTGKILSNKPDNRGRINWCLFERGKGIQKQAAVWIALTYPELVEGEWFPGAVIDHINTDKCDNRPENLRWCTQKDNVNNPLSSIRRIEALPRGENHPMYGKHPSDETREKLHLSHLGHPTSQETRNKISLAERNHPKFSKKVYQYTKDGILVAEYPSAAEAERVTGISKGNICKCRDKKPRYKTAGGYVWTYEKNEAN